MIAELISFKGNEVRITFSDGSSFLVDALFFTELGLIKGNEVDDNVLDEIRRKSEYYKSKKYALSLLRRKSYTEKEIRLKLRTKTTEHSIVEDVIQYIKEYGYVDDNKFAFNYYDQKVRIRKFSLNRIISDLMKKGISREIITELKQEKSTDKVHLDNVEKSAEKKLKSLSNKNLTKHEEKQKLIMHLMQKGFNKDVILTALKNKNML